MIFIVMAIVVVPWGQHGRIFRSERLSDILMNVRIVGRVDLAVVQEVVILFSWEPDNFTI